jgi:hypothetical protein
MILSKIAATAGLSVALFPCACGGHPVTVPYVHYVAASVMFLVLADFCYIFYRRARSKGFPQAKFRAGLYAISGIAIVLSIVVLAFNGLLKGALSARIPNLVFYGEATGLVAFGVSWLNASHVLPVINRPEERFSPLSDENPAQEVNPERASA